MIVSMNLLKIYKISVLWTISIECEKMNPPMIMWCVKWWETPKITFSIGFCNIYFKRRVGIAHIFTPFIKIKIYAHYNQLSLVPIKSNLISSIRFLIATLPMWGFNSSMQFYLLNSSLWTFRYNLTGRIFFHYLLK